MPSFCLKLRDASPRDAVTRSDGHRVTQAQMYSLLSPPGLSNSVGFGCAIRRGAIVQTRHSDRQYFSQSAMSWIRLAKKSERR